MHICPLTIEIRNCHSRPLDAFTGGGRSATWSAYTSFNNRDQKLPFLSTRCLYQGGRSDTWSAYISFNNRNQKLPFLATRCLYQGGRSATWSDYMRFNNRNQKLPFLATRCLYQGQDLPSDLPIWALIVKIWNCYSWPLDASTGGGRSATWSPYMSFNNRDQKLPFLSTRCLYQEGRSDTWSAYMNFNNRNLKLPFLETRCLYQGGRSATWYAYMSFNNRIRNCHSWQLYACTRGLYLPSDLPI